MKSPKCKIEMLQLVEDSVSSFPATALKCHNIKENESMLLLRCDNVIYRECTYMNIVMYNNTT